MKIMQTIVKNNKLYNLSHEIVKYHKRGMLVHLDQHAAFVVYSYTNASGLLFLLTIARKRENLCIIYRPVSHLYISVLRPGRFHTHQLSGQEIYPSGVSLLSAVINFVLHLSPSPVQFLVV